MNKWYTPDAPLEPPAEPPIPRCPVCGAETYDLIEDFFGHVVGCPECIRTISAISDDE